MQTTVAQEHIFRLLQILRSDMVSLSWFFFIVTEQRKFYINVLFKYIAGSPGGQLTAKREISAVGLRYCLRIFLTFGLVEASALLIHFKMTYLIVTRTLGQKRWAVSTCLVAKITWGNSALDLQPYCLLYQCSDQSALVEVWLLEGLFSWELPLQGSRMQRSSLVLMLLWSNQAENSDLIDGSRRHQCFPKDRTRLGVL